MKLTKEEKQVFSKFLDELEGYQDCAGCNDMRIPNTPGYRKLLIAASKEELSQLSKEERESWKAENISGKYLQTMDATILAYVRKKVEKILGIEEVEDVVDLD